MTPRGEARRAIILTLGFDVTMAFIAMMLALIVPWAMTDGWPTQPYALAIGVSLVFSLCGLASLILLDVHKQVWRHAGWPDAIRIVQVVLLTALVFLPIIFLWNRLSGIPRSSLLFATAIWLFLLFSGRMIALSRSTHRPFQIFTPVRADAPLVVMVASSTEAAEVLRDFQKNGKGAPVRILGLIETTGADSGRAIRGVPVLGGLDDLANVLDILGVRYEKTPWVAVAGSLRKKLATTQILEIAATRKTSVMALGAGKEGLHLLPARPADLLSRRVRKLDPTPVQETLSGQSVFITGAGGTIGSELSRQCQALAVERMTLFEGSEYNLYNIDLELRETGAPAKLTAQLGNVRDLTLLKNAMKATSPDTVIHAAALKHVPLMEENPCEAILTNVGGAINAIDAAIAAKASRFVFISTDKAVDPDNVMGATKRLAELAIAYRARDRDIAVAMVRFGNVLGSSGSVVPLFERQISNDGPVTLTHEEVTRYFMTVEEASSLVLQAAAHQTEKGDAGLFVLDMGKPIRIKSLAESMIRMKGMVPDVDIMIKTTGLRPGEKLHEALTYPHERLEPTGIDGLRAIRPQDRLMEPEDFWTLVESLLHQAEKRDTKAALQTLSKLVPAYRPPQD